MLALSARTISPPVNQQRDHSVPWRTTQSVSGLTQRSGVHVAKKGRIVTQATEERSTSSEGEESLSDLADDARQALAGPKKRRRKSDSSDFITSALTRRFGLAGGLAWVGFLTFGVVSEQLKTRREVAEEETGTKDVKNAPEVKLPSGVVYQDLKTGGGQPIQKGFLVILDYKGTANGEVFEDTQQRGKPIVFLSGSRPFTGGLCLGAEEGLSGMRAGGRRRVVVPASRGFGEAGAVLRPTEHVPEKRGSIPKNADLTYDFRVVRVSIAPS